MVSNSQSGGRSHPAYLELGVGLNGTRANSPEMLPCLTYSQGVGMSNLPAAHVDLQAMAKQIMLEHGFEPDFPDAVEKQMASIQPKLSAVAPKGARDLRGLLWSSIDNDTSRDLD